MSGQGAGKCTVSPVLLQKGDTKLALYGLGYMRDARLYRMLNTPGEVTWQRPAEDESSWFNLMFIHQNRAARAQKNFVSEKMLPQFLDFVVWGHEHACRVDPQPSAEGGGNFMVSQPGSSVVVSLSEDESIPKQVLLLELRQQMYRHTPLPLTTCRPFVFRNIVLKDCEALKDRADDAEAVFAFLQQAVNNSITSTQQQQQQHAGTAATAGGHAAAQQGDVDLATLPLVRLRVDHSGGYPTIPQQRFGQSFVKRVANPWELLQFHKAAAKRGAGAGARRAHGEDDGMAPGPGGGDEDIELGGVPELDDFRRIDALVSEHLPADLSILQESDMAAALEAFVQQDEKNAIDKAVRAALLESQKRVAAKGAQAAGDGGAMGDGDKDLLKAINSSVAEMKDAKKQQRGAKAAAAAARAGPSGAAVARGAEDGDFDRGEAALAPMDEDDLHPPPAPAGRRASRGGAAGAVAAKEVAPRRAAPRRAAAKKAAVVDESDSEDEGDGIDDDDDDAIRPISKRKPAAAARAVTERDDDAMMDGEEDAEEEDELEDEPTPRRGKGAPSGRGGKSAARGAGRGAGRATPTAAATRKRKPAAGAAAAVGGGAPEVIDLIDSGDDEPTAKAPRTTAAAPQSAPPPPSQGTMGLPPSQVTMGSARGGWGSLKPPGR